MTTAPAADLSPETTAAALQLPPGAAAILKPDWPLSAGRRPDDLPLCFTPAALGDAVAWTGLPLELAAPLAELAADCWRDPSRRALLWYCTHQLNYPESRQSFAALPELAAALGDRAGLFYLLAGLSIIPTAVARYRADGVSDEIIRASLRQFDCFCNNHRIGHHGLPGLITRQINWLRHYRDGRLFRLGRLEYKLDQAAGFAMVLRRRSDGIVVALAEDGQRFDRHGLIEYDGHPDPLAWTAAVLESDTEVAGHPIHPAGHVLDYRESYPLERWEIIVRKGDPVIDLHIPSGGGLSPELCRDSFRQAAAFFARRHPGDCPRLFWCASWIFNPQLAEKLPTSNLAAFQREPYLFPLKSSGADGMFFVFCRDCDDLRTLPRDSSLQRVMLEILESGARLRSLGMFFLLDDLDQFGSQYYRRHSLPPP